MPPAAPAPAAARLPAEDPGQPGQPGVQLFYLGRAGALLRAEHGGRAGRPEQRGLHIGQAADPAGRRAAQPGQVHGGQAAERPAACGQWPPGRAEEPGAERGQRPGAAVGGGGAAERDRHLARPGVQRMPDDLAQPGGLRAQRVGRGQQREPAGPGQFHRGPAAGQFQPRAVGRAPVRPGDPGPVPAGAGHRGGQHVQGALAAVGERNAPHVIAGPGAAPPVRQGRRGVRRGDAALERVRRDDDLHCGVAGPGWQGGSTRAARIACCTSSRSLVASMVRTYSLRPKRASTGSVFSW